MKTLNTRLAAACAVMLFSGSALSQLPTQPFLFGEWEGVMTVVPQQDDGAGLAYPFDGQQFMFRLAIGETNLVMKFSDNQGGWVPIGEGSDLRLNQAGRSAIVIAAMSDQEPTETWMLNITRWDEENISVFWSQLTSPAEANGAPANPVTAFGQMQRISQ